MRDQNWINRKRTTLKNHLLMKWKCWTKISKTPKTKPKALKNNSKRFKLTWASWLKCLNRASFSFALLINKIIIMGLPLLRITLSVTWESWKNTLPPLSPTLRSKEKTQMRPSARYPLNSWTTKASKEQRSTLIHQLTGSLSKILMAMLTLLIKMWYQQRSCMPSLWIILSRTISSSYSEATRYRISKKMTMIMKVFPDHLNLNI